MPIRGASAPAGGVLGRDTELGQIGAWLAPGPGPAGPRLVLVIEGEPGIGKTTLWTEATGLARAAGWHVLSCRPAASDAGLPHVGLADLLRSVPDDAFARLPAPQRRALGVALLREEAGGIDLDPRGRRHRPDRPAGADRERRPADARRGRRPVAGPGLGPGPGLRAAAAGRPATATGDGRPHRGARWRAGRRVRRGGGVTGPADGHPRRGRPAERGRDPPDVRPHARLVVRPAGAGPDPPGRGRQPVLRPGDRP